MLIIDKEEVKMLRAAVRVLEGDDFTGEVNPVIASLDAHELKRGISFYRSYRMEEAEQRLAQEVITRYLRIRLYRVQGRQIRALAELVPLLILTAKTSFAEYAEANVWHRR